MVREKREGERGPLSDRDGREREMSRPRWQTTPSQLWQCGVVVVQVARMWGFLEGVSERKKGLFDRVVQILVGDGRCREGEKP